MIRSLFVVVWMCPLLFVLAGSGGLAPAGERGLCHDMEDGRSSMRITHNMYYCTTLNILYLISTTVLPIDYVKALVSI